MIDLTRLIPAHFALAVAASEYCLALEVTRGLAGVDGTELGEYQLPETREGLASIQNGVWPGLGELL